VLLIKLIIDMSFLKKIFSSSEDNQNKSNMKWNQLISIHQFEEIIASSNDMPILIFKHSTRCSISRFALKQFENDFDSYHKVTPYFLDLLQYREVSNEVALRFKVVHQSPQLIVVSGGSCVYHTSHSDINASEIDGIL
jgi:bacillithiol system protein YtxJ